MKLHTALHCRFAAAGLWLALFAACAAAPPPPVADDLGIEIPAAWPAAAATGSIDVTWWTGFGDDDLDALVAATLQDNRDLLAAVARVEATIAQRTIAAAALFPEVDAGANIERARRLFLGFPFGGQAVASNTLTTYGLSLSARWELDVWGRLRAGDAAALADQQAAIHDLAALRLSLVGQLCRAYFSAVEAREQLALAEETVASIRATYDDVNDRFRRGVRPALDVYLAATNLANAEASASVRREALQRALRQIDLISGRYPSGLATSKAVLPAPIGPPPVGLPAELLQRRPDLAAAERRVAAAGCRVDAARAALYPQLSFAASGGTQSLDVEDLVDDQFRLWSLGANLLQPLFRAGALRAQVEVQLARRREAFAEYAAAVLRAYTEVESVLATERDLRKRRDELARAAGHAARSRDLARERWQLGLSDFLAVADGQRQAFLARSELIAAERALLDNRIELYLALGGGFELPAAGGDS